ncbi:hypothetical protein [uncultured Maricaulis sp.]|uniref:hypothetical protein n=1 Tax=uncultured Maricaulis sp. TaxID=174710 RepID=UPI00261D1653|nr:hypothetical protein [uncultured Maricaulis sp.]
MSNRLSSLAALLRLILVITGPVAIWFSFRWTATAEGVAQFDGFLDTSRALAAFGAASWVIASLIAAARLGGDPLIARLARAGHANLLFLLYLLIIGTPATLVVPVLAILVSDGDALLRPRPGDGLSANAAPIALIGQLLAVLGAGLPLLAAAMGWIGHDWALNGWLIGLWLAAAFKLYRFMPGPARAE